MISRATDQSYYETRIGTKDFTNIYENFFVPFRVIIRKASWLILLVSANKKKSPETAGLLGACRAWGPRPIEFWPLDFQMAGDSRKELRERAWDSRALG
ncbi:MAG: hypothetical protein A3H71_03115 [Candidatus Sungbacteria bacterium RIFCSPLOWO2_02_FULL_48_13b]|uniref:Uncharacterized protein n=1 Tax=Candidatus Sungbacteria bacterium RIFCSPLOWO2_02_FULL_48_13b TaxID=1802283 RepID=A0A1G2LH97_9BACT|nr:MAG: hypothetical protein A3H71_03115 [Candidatus Sungbacteria bacterium RIFCSPLOWO2_02_FULL_48_13b]